MESQNEKNLLLSGDQRKQQLPYEVGALLYAPATNHKILNFILRDEPIGPYSASLCLEDSISDDSVALGEARIVTTLAEIARAMEEKPDRYLPKLFIRVRHACQIPELYERLGSCSQLLCGFIAPKYSTGNAEAFNAAIREVNARSRGPVYLMPTLESGDIVSLPGRGERLALLRERIDEIGSLVLNVRVGGNDFCNAFGIRRGADETIYDILAVSRILSDIIATFSPDYVVSGPVWEYFDSSSKEGPWKEGLQRELKLDRLNGFVGKTVIHPCQTPVINQALKVSPKDWEDAANILSWSGDSAELVSKNHTGDRMNEIKVHSRWAQKIVLLGQLYGIQDSQ